MPCAIAAARGLSASRLPMDRSRYYAPARPPFYTYALTGLAALFVLSAIIYLNVFHHPPQRLHNASRFPPSYPALDAIVLYDEDGAGYALADADCGDSLLALMGGACPAVADAMRTDYSAFAQTLADAGIAPPPLFIVWPPAAEGQAPAGGEGACLECSGQGCARLVRAPWPAASVLYAHFNQAMALPGSEDQACGEGGAGSWMLIDGGGRPRAYIHKRGPAKALARDYRLLSREMAASQAQHP